MTSETHRFLCETEEIEKGEMRRFEAGGKRAVVLVRTEDDSFYAFRPDCPHQGAPLWKGMITGLASGDRLGENRLIRLGQILRCPWHGFEYDLETGCSIVDKERLRFRTYRICIEGKRVYLER